MGTDAPEDTGLSIAAPDLTAGEEEHRVSQLETQMLKVRVRSGWPNVPVESCLCWNIDSIRWTYGCESGRLRGLMLLLSRGLWMWV